MVSLLNRPPGAAGPDLARPAVTTPIDALLALGLAVASLLAHLPLRTEMLFAWDSVLYVEALDHFDIGANRPQPPGYLFYVLTARLVGVLAGLPPNDAYIWVSQVAAAATVGALYLAGREFFGRTVGVIAALLAASSVAFSIYSAVAYPYSVLALTSTLLGWLGWRVREGRSPAWLAGLALGVLSGFRQDLLLFLGPLVLISIGVRSPIRLLGAALAGAAGLLTWFIPTVLLSGGLPAFLAALTAQSARIERDTSAMAHGLAGLLTNTRSLLRYSLHSLWLAALPFLLWPVVMLASRASRRDPRLWHLALWAGPAILFYAVIHIGDMGYVFSFMPAAWLAAAAGLNWVSDIRGRVSVRRSPTPGRDWVSSFGYQESVRLLPTPGARSPAPTTLHPSLLALAALPIAFNLWWLVLSERPLSVAWLHCQDRQLAEAVAYVRATYSPANTVLLTAGHYQQTRFYLPEYPIWFHDSFKDPVLRRPVPPGIDHVVIFDWLLEAVPHPQARAMPLSCGRVLDSFAVVPGDRVVVRPPRVELAR